MDQVIVTIISSAVVLIAALGGGAIGAILTNRYAQRQDKRRKETEVIEELYGLAIKVRTSVDAYLLAGPNSTLSDFPVPELVNVLPSEQVWPSDVSTCPPM